MGIFTVFKRTKSCLYFNYPFDLSKQAKWGGSWLLMRFGNQAVRSEYPRVPRVMEPSWNRARGGRSPSLDRLHRTHGHGAFPISGCPEPPRFLAWGLLSSNRMGLIHSTLCNSWRPGGMVKSAVLTKNQEPLKPSNTTRGETDLCISWKQNRFHIHVEDADFIVEWIVLHYVMAFIHFFNPQSADKLFVSKAAGIFWKGKAGFVLCPWDVNGIFSIF